MFSCTISDWKGFSSFYQFRGEVFDSAEKLRELTYSQLSSLRHFYLKICPMGKHSKDDSNQLMGRRQ